MPSWKKVITSGSDASLNSLNVINGITGSLLGTASFATSASYVNPLNQLVIITGSLIQGIAGNIATGEYSHAEGSITKALGDYSHAEGDNTQAIGNYSHAEGQETIASGSYSHAEGYGTIALADHQHVQGQWNITTSVPSAFIVGNGTDNGTRSNLIYAAGTQVEITGSLVVSDSITGSLQGTSSYANEALTASYALSSTSAASASYVLNAVSSSFATTASFVNTLDQNLTLIGNQTITGSLTVTNNLIVLGSSSLQYMSQSTLNVGTNLITVNTFNPSVRFGGLAVIDSGSSPQVSGSFLYDSFHDEFIFVHRGDGTNVTSSHFLVGPQTYNDLGNETYIAANTLLKSQGNEHVVASNITDNGSFVTLNSNTAITGSLYVSSSNTTQLQVGSNLLFVSSSGRVGIGTTSPQGIVHIRSNFANSYGQFTIQDPTGVGSASTIYESYYDSANTRLAVFGFGRYGGTNDPNYYFANEQVNGGIVFRNSSANIVTIANNGNVGIGTSTPNTKLHVNGNVQVTGSLSVTGSATFDGNVFITGSGTNSLTVRGTGATSATNALAIQNSLGSSSLVVRNDGALVIGRGLGVITSPADGTLTISAQTANAYRVQITANEYVYVTSPLGIVMPSGQTFLGYGAFKFSAIGGSQNVTTGTFNQQLFNDSFTPTTGTGIFNALNISNAVSQSAAATGVSRGILISPTLTRAQDYRAIETTNGRVIFAGSGSALPIFTVQGSQGELFSVTDSLSGSLFSVNDISGLPILEVFSDNTILMGDYQDPMLLTTKKITQTVSGPFTVYSIPTASYDGAFIDYTIKSGSNARAGTIMSTWANSLIEFTEVDTMDIGSTTAVNLSMVLSGANAILTGSSSTGAWTIRTIIRTI